MARDVHELILARLREILVEVATARLPEVVSVYRNQGDYDNILLPALVLLDGEEQRQAGGHGGVQRMLLAPQVWVVLKPKTQAAEQEDVGPELSAYRMEVLQAFMDDGPLAVLQGENGEIEYRGYTTDLQSGSTMLGTMRVDLGFSYLFDPVDLE